MNRARAELIGDLAALMNDIINRWEYPQTKDKLERVMKMLPEDLKNFLATYANMEGNEDNPTAVISEVAFATGYLWAMNKCSSVFRRKHYGLLKDWRDLIEMLDN